LRAVKFNVECSLQYPDTFFYIYGLKLVCNKKKIQRRRLEMEAIQFCKQPLFIYLFISNAINNAII